MYIGDGFVPAGWRPPAAPGTLVVVEDAGKSGTSVRQYCHEVFKEIFMVESDWAVKRTKRPYTLYPTPPKLYEIC